MVMRDINIETTTQKCVYAHTRVCMHVHTRVCVYVHTRVCVCVCVCVCVVYYNNKSIYVICYAQ